MKPDGSIWFEIVVTIKVIGHIFYILTEFYTDKIITYTLHMIGHQPCLESTLNEQNHCHFYLFRKLKIANDTYDNIAYMPQLVYSTNLKHIKYTNKTVIQALSKL